MSQEKLTTINANLPEERLYDVRLLRRRLARGDVERKSFDDRLKKLEDLDNVCEPIEATPPWERDAEQEE